MKLLTIGTIAGWFN
ncbi:Protein of unknown function [Bacillus cereus]|nr:Protein of unknown function [Bacillus cereus]SCN31147.1 Protein of unknown function [Bacillus wiedmannii]